MRMSNQEDTHTHTHTHTHIEKERERKREKERETNKNVTNFPKRELLSGNKNYRIPDKRHPAAAPFEIASFSLKKEKRTME